MSYIYLASPYTHPNPFVRDRRYLAASDTVAWLLKHHIWTYSPIVHCHELAKRNSLPPDADFWWDYDKAMLMSAAELKILTLDGWDTSRGVNREIAFAATSNIPITYIQPQNGDA